MTPAGLAALKAELRLDEGLRLKAYQDEGGVWTIGYGHTGPEVRAGLVWVAAQAEAAFDGDIDKAVDECGRYIGSWPRLDDPRQLVLVDMAFNLGIRGLLRFHHMLAAVGADDYGVAAADLLATEPWRSQVGKRADRLAAIMRTGVNPDLAHRAGAWSNAQTHLALEAEA